jgi:hypothetical protein
MYSAGAAAYRHGVAFIEETANYVNVIGMSAVNLNGLAWRRLCGWLWPVDSAVIFGGRGNCYYKCQLK